MSSVSREFATVELLEVRKRDGFLKPQASSRCGFCKGTLAAAHGEGQDVLIPAICGTTLETAHLDPTLAARVDGLSYPPGDPARASANTGILTLSRYQSGET